MADFQVEVQINDPAYTEAFDLGYKMGHNEGWEAGYEAGFMAADSYIQFEGGGI